MRKRIAVSLLALWMCLTQALAAGIEDNSPALYVSLPETLPAVGETFTVSVEISGNPGICSVQFTLRSNDSVVECVSANIGSVLTGALSAANPSASNGAIIAAANTQTMNQDGSLGVLIYRVVAEGDPQFQLTDIVLSDENIDDVPYTIIENKEIAPDTPSPETGDPGDGIGGSTPPEVPETAPSDDSTDNVAPSDDSADNAAPSDDSTDDVAPSDDSTDNDVPSDDSTDNDAPSDDSTDNDAPSNDSADDAAPSDDSTDNDAPSDDSTDNDAPSDDSADNTAPSDDSADNTAPSNDSADNAAPSDDSADNDAPSDDSTDNDAPSDDSTEPQAPDDETAYLFSDVPEDYWANEYIAQAVKAGWFQGYADGSFRPGQNVTRVQLVTVLWRDAGRPEAAQAAPFIDLDGLPDEFQQAAAWGYENGYVTGYETEQGLELRPNGSVTRQQAMAILYRYCGAESGAELLLGSIYDGQFTDSGEIASYARNAMYWALYHEIINGTSATTLSPTGLATRAQIAKILVNCLGSLT